MTKRSTQSGSGKKANPRKPPSRRLPRIGTILIDSLEQRWRKYLNELRRCKRAFSEEAVHDVRVATRRLISTLLIIRIVYPDRNMRKIERRLKRLFDSMSPLRDAQVQLLSLQEKVMDYPELETLLTVLKVRERNLMDSISRRISTIDTISMGRSFRGLKEGLRRHFSRPMMGEICWNAVLGAALGRFNAAVWGKEHSIPSRPATIHRARIAFKKFRYTLEAIAPMLPAADKRMLKAMDEYQTRMGSIQDARILNDLVARFTQQRPPALRRELAGLRRELLARKKELISHYEQSADELYSLRKPMLTSRKQGTRR
ncbi:MAG: CHAD domain-containing protein [Bacteroidetes bacterium]|nr:CHAD domain-containing protein [Bacteroidota bacterium]MCW5894704.1 CHAD domain-containing protein [Bacteroidota bacterium]